MTHVIRKAPARRHDAASRGPLPAGDRRRPAVKRGTPPSRGARLAFHAQAFPLQYLRVVLILGAIALLKAPGADIPQVIVSLHTWLPVP